MARGGGRPRLSEDAKARNKASREEQAASAMAQNAMARLPEDKAKRDELWMELQARENTVKGKAGEVAAQKKRMHEIFGITKPAMAIRKILLNCASGEYEATYQQVLLFMRDAGRPMQMDLFAEPGKGGVPEPDAAPFDNTRTGKAMGGEPTKSSNVVTLPVAKPSPGIPPEEAAKAFTEATDKTEAERAAAGQPSLSEQAEGKGRRGGRKNAKAKAAEAEASEVEPTKAASDAATAGDAHIKQVLADKAAPETKDAEDELPPPPAARRTKAKPAEDELPPPPGGGVPKRGLGNRAHH